MEVAHSDLETSRKALLSLKKKYPQSNKKIHKVIKIVADKIHHLEYVSTFEDLGSNLTYIEDHFMQILDTYFKDASWYDYFRRAFKGIRDNCQLYLRSSTEYEKVSFEAFRPRENPELPDTSFRGDNDALLILEERTQICEICKGEIIGYTMQDMIQNGGKDVYPGGQPWVIQPNFKVIMACICSLKCDQTKKAKELWFVHSKGIRAKRQSQIVWSTCPICYKSMQKLMKCAKCQCAYYCSEECQTQEWPAHQAICKDIVQKQKEGRLF